MRTRVRFPAARFLFQRLRHYFTTSAEAREVPTAAVADLPSTASRSLLTMAAKQEASGLAVRRPNGDRTRRPLCNRVDHRSLFGFERRARNEIIGTRLDHHIVGR